MKALPYLVVLFLILSSCTTSRKGFFSTADDCEILAEKRTVSHGRKQPKVKSNRVTRTSHTQLKGKPLVFTVDPTYPFKLEPTEIYASIKVVPESETKSQKQIDETGRVNDVPAKIDEVPCPTPVPENLSEVNRTEQLSAVSILGFFAISSLSSMLLFSLFSAQFMKVSAWAAHHPLSAKGIMAGVHTAAIAGSYVAGNFLVSAGMIVPLEVFAIAGGLSLAGALGYPRKQTSIGTFTADYLRHKCCDILLFTGGTAMLFCVGNHQHSYFKHTDTVAPLAAMYSYTNTQPNVDEDNITTKKPDQPKQEAPPKKKVGLKILAVILFIAATLAVTALSCAMVCAGQELLAILFAGAAETGLVFLLISVFRSLNGTKRARRTRTTNAIPATS